MRIVIDNNIFISGIFWQGPPNKIIKLVEKGYFDIYSSSKILEELFNVLERKKFDSLFEEAQTTRSEVFLKILELVKIISPIKNLNIIKDDPDDNRILECALTGSASFIISGDNHLLKLKSFQNILILNPRQFCNYSGKFIADKILP